MTRNYCMYYCNNTSVIKWKESVVFMFKSLWVRWDNRFCGLNNAEFYNLLSLDQWLYEFIILLQNNLINIRKELPKIDIGNYLVSTVCLRWKSEYDGEIGQILWLFQVAYN